jgi:hypothetical protein
MYPGLRCHDRVGIPPRISTDLTIGRSPARNGVHSSTLSVDAKKPDDVKRPGLVLFGQTILTEQQMSSAGATSPAATGRNSSLDWCYTEKAGNVSEGSGSGVIQNSSPSEDTSPERLRWFRDNSSHSSELGLEPGQCKVFVESETVGRNLDLSAMGSFQELYGRLSDMFCIEEGAELRSRVLYRGAAGEVKHAGDESFR